MRPHPLSIAPPSDIVMDVAQAADPARRQAAVAKLAAQAAAQGGSPPVDFAATLSSATPGPGTRTDPSLRLSPLVGAGRSQGLAGRGSPYQKFEAMVLQNFVESMLPKDTELFGDSASADACRSMFAGKIADQLARSGRIGIAQSIEHFQSHAAAAASAVKLPDA